MDARVHRLQGEAERVKPAELVRLLEDCFRERLQLMVDHQDSARRVRRYEFNNAYQNIIAREETHLEWLAEAIRRLGGSPSESLAPRQGTATEREAIESDRRREQEFVDRWRPRVAQVTHARHRKMLDLILGESREHVRFLGEAVAGDTDLLGRGAPGAGERGSVLPDRWVG